MKPWICFLGDFFSKENDRVCHVRKFADGLSLILLLGWDSRGLDKGFGCKDFFRFLFKDFKVKFLMFLSKFWFNFLPKIPYT